MGLDQVEPAMVMSDRVGLGRFGFQVEFVSINSYRTSLASLDFNESII